MFLVKLKAPFNFLSQNLYLKNRSFAFPESGLQR